MPDEAITTNAVSLKLPDFWPSDPELWFAQAEALFTAQNITQEKTKFAHVVRVLPAQYASEVRDIILRPPEEPYTAIKEELQKRVCPSKRQQLHQLLHVEDLGDREPSQLLRHMLKLRGGTAAESDKDEIFRELFLQKLPVTVRTALAIHKTTSLSDIAEIADNMVEVQGPQGQISASEIQQRENSEIAAVHTELQKIWRVLQSQQKPSLDERQRGPTPDVCWYHERFGSKATKCREPCKFLQQSGNSKASR